MIRSLKLALVAISMLATSARAEGFHEGALFGLSWEMAGPVSQLRSNHLDLVSPYALQADLRFWLGRNLSTGFALGWNLFSNGVRGEELNAVSARATAHYYLTRSQIQPYLGIGAGAVWRHMSGGGAPSDDFFGFCADPQLGVLLAFDRGVSLHLALRYEFTTTWAWDVAHAQWFGVQVGAAFY